MKPVAIFRTTPSEGPGYFATSLERKGIDWKLVALDEGRAVPKDARRYAGLVFMGGPMRVIPALELVRDAVRKDVPVLGHCLGGQLMAKAMGGAVKANPVKEIGWGEVKVASNSVARTWLGTLDAFESFHWHGETFSIPPGGTRVLENAHCANQAFALGKHFGMQCHVEMTEKMIGDWLEGGAKEIEEAKASPGVQKPEKVREDLDRRLTALHAVADRIYDRWIEGLSRGS
jgi:GMP synthase-like glutamine amidotransferase